MIIRRALYVSLPIAMRRGLCGRGIFRHNSEDGFRRFGIDLLLVDVMVGCFPFRVVKGFPRMRLGQVVPFGRLDDAVKREGV